VEQLIELFAFESAAIKAVAEFIQVPPANVWSRRYGLTAANTPKAFPKTD